MVVLSCGDVNSTISIAELGEKSFVKPDRMQMLHPEALVEAARLEKGQSFEMTIKESQFVDPIKHRFTHK